MIDEVYYPITYKSAKTNQKTFTTWKLDAQDKLRRLLNRGYEIITKNVVDIDSGTFEVIVLYRRPKSRKENGAALIPKDQSHAA